MTLRQLRALQGVARNSSFTRAAAELNLSQPALTVQIRELEAALGLKLLDRNTRSVRLTAIGRELLPVFERVLEDLRAVAENARGLAAGDRGLVQVAALPSVCAGLLPAALAALRRTHPGIRVRLADTPARRILALVASEEVDLGIGGFGALGPEFESAHLMRDRLVAVLPKKHVLARAPSVALRDLARHPLVFMDSQSSVRAIVESALAGQGVTPAYEVTYMSTAVGLVRAGLGVALLPSSAIELELAGVAVRPVARGVLDRDIVVVHKRARALAPAARHFIDALARAALRPAKQSR
ncbi:MAG: LysR family transcriptional regulator [Usitatibacter sp.]